MFMRELSLAVSARLFIDCTGTGQSCFEKKYILTNLLNVWDNVYTNIKTKSNERNERNVVNRHRELEC